MHTLGIDIETFSGLSLKEYGLHRYVENEEFEILLIGYSIDRGPVSVIDLTNVTLEEEREWIDWFVSLLTDANYLKTAWNAQFEMTCLSRWFQTKLLIEQWECTMIKASMCGYPMSLETTGKAMNLAVQKSPTGKKLIKMFSERQKNGSRILPAHNPVAWGQYIQYNKFDVLAEQAISQRLDYFKIPEKEKRIWQLDQRINQRGIKVDRVMAQAAVEINTVRAKQLTERAIELTGVKPTQIAKLKEWIEAETLEGVEKLDKVAIKEMLEEGNSLNGNVEEVLKIRQEIGKSSVKKYIKMLDCMGSDEHARFLLQFHGAGKTGRWGSRLIQIHNLPKNKLEDIDVAREHARRGELEVLELLYGNVSDIMSQLIRTAFVADDGYTLLVSDFSAIEARVTAWFAGEEWRLKVFRGDGKIYEESGARMFKTTVEAVGKDKDGLRFKAKTAELALGFQGGVGSLDRMEEMGLKLNMTQLEKQDLVNKWRQANEKIVELWWELDEAAIEAVQNPGQIVKVSEGRIKFLSRHKTLWIQLPSGRMLAYVEPFIKTNKRDRIAVGFWGLDQKTNQWSKQESYGGKWLENIVQGTARDLLADAMLRLDEKQLDIRMHVHDEAVMQVPADLSEKCQKAAGDIMESDVPWAKGLPIRAESYLTNYYLKK